MPELPRLHEIVVRDRRLEVEHLPNPLLALRGLDDRGLEVAGEVVGLGAVVSDVAGASRVVGVEGLVDEDVVEVQRLGGRARSRCRQRDGFGELGGLLVGRGKYVLMLKISAYL